MSSWSYDRDICYIHGHLNAFQRQIKNKPNLVLIMYTLDWLMIVIFYVNRKQETSYIF